MGTEHPQGERRAYGWPHDLTDDEILARLLALNLGRAAEQGQAPVTETAEEENEEYQL